MLVCDRYSQAAIRVIIQTQLDSQTEEFTEMDLYLIARRADVINNICDGPSLSEMAIKNQNARLEKALRDGGAR